MRRSTVYRLRQALASQRFWLIIMGFFVVESLWIALSARYPMAFDEDFHLGIIKLYAGQWLPFFGHTPAGAAAFGGVTQDPSYLYHYLMSFPYRFFHLFTHDQTTIAILLRLINIALAAASLVLFRKVLQKAGAGRLGTNMVMAIFVLIPVVPLLAGQINYDNLLMLCVAAMCLLVQRIIDGVKAGKLPLGTIMAAFGLGLLGSLVKYAFLPIFAASGIFVLGYIWMYRHRKSGFGTVILASWRALSGLKQATLIVLAIISLGLFAQRYVVNMIAYHTPIPDCSKVLDNEACQQYGPWNRDYNLAQNKSDNNESSPIAYMGEWLYGMWYRLFFMINGNFKPNVYQNFAPLPIIGVGAILLLAFGIFAYAARFKDVMKNQPHYAYFLAISLTYIVILWIQNYGAFLHTGQPVAVNGRYLLPILLPIGAILATSIALLLKKLPKFRLSLAVLVLLVFLEGGGLMSFIVRSNSEWYWQNNAVQTTNDSARDLLSPLVIGSRNTLPIPSP